MKRVLQSFSGKCYLSVGIMLLFLINTGHAQTTTFTATGSWTCPAGITSITVECWGGGGAGGGNTTTKDGGGGGGGGAYSQSVLAVTAGVSYTVTVGTGATGTTGNGTAGLDTWFNTAATILAKGGGGGFAPSGGNGGNGGTGGAFAAGIGTARFSGGNGGAGRNNNSGLGGPGGSSAGTAANGTSGAATWSTVTAAAAPAGGGIGGNGGNNGTSGSAGISPGGAGGGSGDGTHSGGDGANGKAVITYGPCVVYSLNSTTTASPICINNSATVNLASSASNLPVGTYTVTYNLSGANIVTGAVSAMTVTTAGTGSFVTATLSNPGSTTVTITNLSSGSSSVSATLCSSAISANNTATFTVSGVAALSYAFTTSVYCNGSSISNNDATISGIPTLYAISPNLTTNTGLSFNTSTGRISGTPTILSASVAYTVTASNACNSTSTTVNISVVTPLSGLVYSVPGPVTYCVNTAIAANNPTVSGSGTLSYTVSSLPAGLSISSTTGIISGTPTAVTSAANYTVTVTNGCNSTNTTINITIAALPTSTFTVTGGGTYCANSSSGVVVGLSGSQSGVNYQLKINGTNTGTPVAGTGAAISFGIQATPGTYTVTATSATTGCSSTMTGNVTVVRTGILPGTYTVGPTGNYASIGATVTVLSNACTSGGAYIFELQSSYVSTAETFPITIPLYSWSSATNTVTYRPQTSGSNLSVTGSTGAPLVDLNAAKYIIFDGRAGGTGVTKDLTIINTNTAWSTVGFRGDAQFNTFRYCNIQGSDLSATQGIVFFSTSSTTGGNSNNTIDNCDITQGSSSPVNGIYSSGTTTSGRRNISNTISNCTIHDIFYGFGDCSAVYMAGGTSDWTITANSIYLTSATNTISITNADWVGIKLNNTASGNNTQITNNYIGGKAALATGSAMTITGAGSFKGIKIAGGSGTSNTVSGNTIQNIAFTTSSTDINACVYHSDGPMDVTSNTIGSQSSTGSIVFSSSTAAGATYPNFSAVFAGGGIVGGTPEAVVGGSVNITNNTIGSITISGTGQVQLRAIDIEEALCQFTVTGNTIGSITAANSINNTTANSTLGIFSTANKLSTVQTISNNTIVNITASSTATGVQLVGLQAQGTPTGGIYTVSNNTVYNLSSASTEAAITAVSGITVFANATASAGHIISQNTVYNLSSTAPTQNVILRGIKYDGPTSGTNIVSKNKVYGMSAASTGAAILYGFQVQGGTTEYSNNMVCLGSSAAGTALTGGHIFNGFQIEAGTNNIYYNSVSITGTGVTGSTATRAFNNVIAGANSTNIKDNLFINTRSNSSGTGKHYGISVTSVTSSASDYNDIYTSGTGGVFGNFNGTDQATLSAWQTATATDANSVSSAATFTNAANDLHLTVSPSVLNFGINNEGTYLSAVLTDIDGATRSIYAPDPGYDEFKGTGSWIGLNSSVWEVSGNVIPSGGNWDDGIVPTSVLDAKVRNAPNMPIISATTGTGTVNNFDLKSPGILTINGGTLQVNGDFVIKAGYLNPITASNGTVEMKGAAAQSLPANLFVTNSLNDLIINNCPACGVTLGGTLDIYSSVTYSGTGRTLNTGDFLTFKSGATKTARFGNMTGNTISGKATVERYFSYPRKWQFISVPTNTTQTIKAAWQEGATLSTQDPVPGYGMQITQLTGSSGTGFDAFSPSGHSVKLYNAAGNNYTGITSTNNAIKTTEGYMAFVRGDRLSLSTFPAGTTNPTTLRTKGLLYTGTQTAISIGANLFASIGNPFASAVDITSLTNTGLIGSVANKGTLYVWDPSLSGIYGLGAFQTLTYNTGTSVYDVTPGGGSIYSSGVCSRIESGQAFFTKATGSGGSVTFTEGSKTTGSNIVSFTGGGGMGATLRTRLYGLQATPTALVDGTLSYFNNDFAGGTEDMDAVKLINTGENMGIRSAGRVLVVDYRTMPKDGDTIPLNMANLRAQHYQIEITGANLQANGRRAFFEDAYLHQSNEVDLNGSVNIGFDIVNIPGSYAADRFRIVFKQEVFPLAFTDITAVRNADKTVTVKWNTENEINVASLEIENSEDDINFIKIGDKPAQNSGATATAYVYEHANASLRANFYRIKSTGTNGSIKHSGVAKVEAIDIKEAVSIYPNPVKGGVINLVFNKKLSGIVTIKVSGKKGELLYSESTNIENLNYVKTISLNPATARGSYHITISGASVKNITLPFILL